MREAGLVEIEVRPIANVYPPGHARRTVLLDFVNNCRDAFTAKDLPTTMN
jgi:hypothetical protein